MKTNRNIWYGLGAVMIAVAAVQGASAAGIEMKDNVSVAGTLSAARLTLPFYGRVAIVALSGGDYTDPADAMSEAHIGEWCSSPTVSNPCLLKIMPGVYNVGSGTVQMRAYVDIEGSGENTTVITGTVNAASFPPPPAQGVVKGADNAEIRFLTISNTGGAGYAAAGMVNINVSPRMTNITVKTSGATYSLGVRNNNSSPVMTNVTVTASGLTYNYGIYNDTGSSPVLTNARVTVTGGAYNYGVVVGGTSAKARISQSLIKASTNTLLLYADTAALVFNSQLDGGAVNNAGTLTCFGVYDENFVFYPDTCP